MISTQHNAAQHDVARPRRSRDALSRTDVPRNDTSPPLSPWRRTLYLVVAAASFALGMLGVVLPGLPTTPFLLVTSALLLRAWPSMHERMLRSRFVGGLLSDWRQHRGVRPHVKVRAIALVFAVVAASIVFGGLSTLAASGIVGCAAVGTCVIVSLPTIRS